MVLELSVAEAEHNRADLDRDIGDISFECFNTAAVDWISNLVVLIIFRIWRRLNPFFRDDSIRTIVLHDWVFTLSLVDELDALVLLDELLTVASISRAS